MSIEDNPPAQASGLIARIKDILLKPSPTWDVIDGEPTTIGRLYTGYALILAAIGPIGSLIGGQVFGIGGFGFGYKPGIVGAIVVALVSYGLALVGVAALALIIDALAPSFGGVRDRIKAFKVAVYSMTAAWVAGVFGLIPALALLGIVGLYSFYLLYLGLPRLMKAPQDKALPYTAVAIVCAIVIWLVIGAVTAPLMLVGAGAGYFGGRGGVAAASGDRVTLPGGGEINVGEMEAAARRMEAAANGEGPPAIPSATLGGLLPATLNGLPRTEMNSSSGGIGGIQGSAATAVYSAGDTRIELSVVDMSAMGGLAAVGGMFNVESSSESEGRYEKTGRVGGRMTMESYDRNARSGEFGVLVADRVMVQAEGSNVDMNALKAAVAAVDARRIEALAR